MVLEVNMTKKLIKAHEYVTGKLCVILNVQFINTWKYFVFFFSDHQYLLQPQMSKLIGHCYPIFP